MDKQLLIKFYKYLERSDMIRNEYSDQFNESIRDELIDEFCEMFNIDDK